MRHSAPQRLTRKHLKSLSLTGITTVFLMASGVQAASQADLDLLGAQTGYVHTILDNRNTKCADDGRCFLGEIRLTLPEGFSGEGDWSFYISHVAPIVEVTSDAFDWQWINGDLNRFTVKAGAKLEGGKTYVLKLLSRGNYYSRYYPMPNIYVAADGLEARVIEATRPAIDPETGIEYLPFVAPMTDEAKLATSDADDHIVWLTPERAYDQITARSVDIASSEFVIIPQPAKITRLSGKALSLKGGVTLRLKGIEQAEVQTGLDYLSRSGVGGFATGPALNITVDGQSGAAESYSVKASGNQIDITAADAAGASHALRSLGQQIAHEGGSLKPLEITDVPRLGFRGLHIDVARNFHSKDFLLKTIDQMAVYKLNRLHLHLGEDEGWRLEIKALPELTEVGAKRCHDPKEDTCLLPQLGAGPEGTGVVNGYLTQEDYIELVRYADARHIQVLPSFDMPGHSRAAVQSMEARYRRLMAEGKPEEANLYRLVEPEDTTQYKSIQTYTDNTLNVCIPATYRFLDKVLDEVVAMHETAGQPLTRYHIGADETAGAWVESPACKALMAETGLEPKQLGGLFIEKVSQGLAARNIVAAGWSDGMGHTDAAKMPKNVQSNIWAMLHTGAINEAHTQGNHGWETVISTPDVTYFDNPYAPDPDERGYDWSSRVTDTYKVFSYQPENLPANAYLIHNIKGQFLPLEDKTPREAGRRITGFQAQLWSETIRTDDAVEYMLFPRLLALSERAWHTGTWEIPYRSGASYDPADNRLDRTAQLKDWQGFKVRAAAHHRLLDRDGIAYRLAPVGAKIENGQLLAVTEFPGLGIEYRTQGGAWQAYKGPVAVTGKVDIRARTPDGKRAGRTVTVGQ